MRRRPIPIEGRFMAASLILAAHIQRAGIPAGGSEVTVVQQAMNLADSLALEAEKRDEQEEAKELGHR